MLTESEKQRLYKRLGEEVRQRRNEASFSQSVLGEKVGLSRSSIVNIEKGRQHPPLHVIWELSSALGVEPEDLIPSREEVKTPGPIDPELETKVASAIADEDPETIRRVAEFIQSSRTSS